MPDQPPDNRRNPLALLLRKSRPVRAYTTTAGKFVPQHVDRRDAARPKPAPADDYAQNGVRSEAFKRWFGDWENAPAAASKVVKRDGSPQETAPVPMVLYHGTPNAAPDDRKRYEWAKAEAARLFAAQTQAGLKEICAEWARQYPQADKLRELAASPHIDPLEVHKLQRAVLGFSDRQTATWKALPTNRNPFDVLHEQRDALPSETRERLDEDHFTAFDPEKRTANTGSADAAAGFFFTDDQDFAHRFTYNVEVDGMLGIERVTPGRKPKVFACFLNIRRPLDLRKLSAADSASLTEIGFDADMARPGVLAAEDSKALQMLVARHRDKLAAMGYDGIINKVKWENRVRTEYIVFSGKQIKAVENAGTFDANSENIYKSYHRPTSRRLDDGRVVQVRGYTDKRSRRVNARPITAYRGMSSREFYAWRDKGVLPKGKDCVDERLEAWANEHAEFGSNDILVAFQAPAQTLRPGDGGKGHWKIDAAIPFDVAAPQVVRGTLKDRAEFEAADAEIAAARKVAREALVPGATIQGRGGTVEKVEILAKRGQRYMVKPHFRLERMPVDRELTDAEGRAGFEFERARNHRTFHRLLKGDAAGLAANGYDGPLPTDEEYAALGDRWHAASLAVLEARMKKFEELSGQPPRELTLRQIIINEQHDTYVDLPDGSEVLVEFGKLSRAAMRKAVMEKARSVKGYSYTRKDGKRVDVPAHTDKRDAAGAEEPKRKLPLYMQILTEKKTDGPQPFEVTPEQAKTNLAKHYKFRGPHDLIDKGDWILPDGTVVEGAGRGSMANHASLVRDAGFWPANFNTRTYMAEGLDYGSLIQPLINMGAVRIAAVGNYQVGQLDHRTCELLDRVMAQDAGFLIRGVGGQYFNIDYGQGLTKPPLVIPRDEYLEAGSIEKWLRTHKMAGLLKSVRLLLRKSRRVEAYSYQNPQTGVRVEVPAHIDRRDPAQPHVAQKSPARASTAVEKKLTPKGNLIYIYDETTVANRQAAKFARVAGLGKAIPEIIADSQKKLKLGDTPQEKVVAAIVYLIDRCNFRIGTERYAERHGTYGVTTLRPEHIAVKGSAVRFKFVGKKQVEWDRTITSKPLAEFLGHLQADAPDGQLFWFNSPGGPKGIRADHVNDYLAQWGVTAKDFRTYHATMGTWQGLEAASRGPKARRLTEKECNAIVKEVVAGVAAQLGHTPAVCKQSYILPAVIQDFIDNGGRVTAPAWK